MVAAAWHRQPGAIRLAADAIDVGFAGRAYAAYGGVYILATLLWLWAVEGARPTAWDLASSGLALTSTLVILAGSQPAR